jgi:hypothetical protein
MNPFETMGLVGIVFIILWTINILQTYGPRDRLVRATKQVWVNELDYWEGHLLYHIDNLERGFSDGIYEADELPQLKQILEDHKMGRDNYW